MSKILIVEDEVVIRSALQKLLKRHGYQVFEAGSIKEAIGNRPLDDYDLIISDLRLPGGQGTELIKMTADIPVLIMTSYASVRSAVDSMRMGAVDYIAKPFDHGEMIDAVANILKQSKSFDDETTPAKDCYQCGEIIGDSIVMKTLFSHIEKVAPTDATVLIQGETGTGKELTARSIHKNSKRSDQPIICINCAAIPENLIESELFGHEKGAFTGAINSRDGLILAADGGTLFLDEIGELPMEAQARLLRVLQEGEVRHIGAVETRKVDVRLLAATHRDLAQYCREGKFREDLFFRLNVVQLQVPPLRERGRDIITLAESLLVHYCKIYKKPPLVLSADAINAITTYPWPGNVRELENAIQRSVILCEHSKKIDRKLLAIDQNISNVENYSHRTGKIQQVAIHTPYPASQEDEKNFQQDLSLDDYFQNFVIENQDSMNETELARTLGVSRKCLWERRQKLGIPRKKVARS